MTGWQEPGWATFGPVRIKGNTNTMVHAQYLTSWKYFRNTKQKTRAMLDFQAPLARAARGYIGRVVPAGRTAIGMHVRRGDKVDDPGLRLPKLAFYRNAMRHFEKKHGSRAFFVVATDDVAWVQKQTLFNGTRRVHVISRRHAPEVVQDLCPCKDNLVGAELDRCSDQLCPNGFSNRKVYVDAALDLAILASCADVVVSVGTFGWWAAWLSGGEVVYFPREYVMTWPDNRDNFKLEDRFPPEWISIDDDGAGE